MENKILLKQLEKVPGLKLNEIKNNLVNGECSTRKHTSRRKNVIGNISKTGSSFLLYKDDRWIPRTQLGIKTIEETIEWVKKDIESLS